MPGQSSRNTRLATPASTPAKTTRNQSSSVSFAEPPGVRRASKKRLIHHADTVTAVTVSRIWTSPGGVPSIRSRMGAKTASPTQPKIGWVNQPTTAKARRTPSALTTG